jgi:hypothetical protein
VIIFASEECLPSEVEKQASEQLERDLQARGLERQMSVTITISPSYMQGWDAPAAFQELYQNW